MPHFTDQRKHAEARARTLKSQEAKARQAVPEGHSLAPVAAQLLPLARYRWEALAGLLGVPKLAGFVLATSCRAAVFIHGASWPRSTHTRAWGAAAYRCQPGDLIELSGAGRGSGPLSTAKFFPFVKSAGYIANPAPDLSEPLPMPGRLPGYLITNLPTD